MNKLTGKYRISKQLAKAWKDKHLIFSVPADQEFGYTAFVEVEHGDNKTEWMYITNSFKPTHEECKTVYEEYVEFYSNNTVEEGVDERLLNISAQGV